MFGQVAEQNKISVKQLIAALRKLPQHYKVTILMQDEDEPGASMACDLLPIVYDLPHRGPWVSHVDEELETICLVGQDMLKQV